MFRKFSSSKTYINFSSIYFMFAFRFVAFFNLSNVSFSNLQKLINFCKLLQVSLRVCSLSDSFFFDFLPKKVRLCFNFPNILSSPRFLAIFSNDLDSFFRVFSEGMGLFRTSTFDLVLFSYDLVFFGNYFNSSVFGGRFFFTRDFIFPYKFVQKYFLVVKSFIADFVKSEFFALTFNNSDLIKLV